MPQSQRLRLKVTDLLNGLIFGSSIFTQNKLISSFSEHQLPPLVIGDIEVSPPVLLAPMAGVSDRSFRLVCRLCGAGMVFSEMISAEAVLRGSGRALKQAEFSPDERPIGIQLFSHDPQALGGAAALLGKLQPDVIDLNFGCPVKKVVRRGAGAGFMDNLSSLSEAVKRVVKNAPCPVTVKIRSGATTDRITAVEAAQRAEAEGAAAITVHARTASQVFKGRADWSVIAKVKESVKIPVIGNGDVTCPEEMLNLRLQTNCDAIMIGRGSYGNPWLFSQCRATAEGEEWQPPSPEKMWNLIEGHLKSVIEDKGVHLGVLQMRKHLGWYSRGLAGANEYRRRVFRLTDPQEVIQISRNFFLNDYSNRKFNNGRKNHKILAHLF